MAKITQIFLLISCCLLFSCQKGKILKLGAEQTESYLPFLKDKKVGVIGNQTSRIDTTHLADKWVRYNESILGSVGIELKLFLTQNAEKSLKSA